jgi:hypothetical protein
LGVENISAQNAQVDKMWEKLLEIALFARTGEHSNSVAILKSFIMPNRPKQAKQKMLKFRSFGARFDSCQALGLT